MVQIVDDLATYLQTEGHGTKGTDIFKGSSPEATDNLVVITDTGGLPNLDVTNVDTVTIQILARNKRQELGRDKLLDIQATLHQLVNTDLGTFTVISAHAVDRPGVIGRDQKERWMIVSNYEMFVRLT